MKSRKIAFHHEITHRAGRKYTFLERTVQIESLLLPRFSLDWDMDK